MLDVHCGRGFTWLCEMNQMFDPNDRVMIVTCANGNPASGLGPQHIVPVLWRRNYEVDSSRPEIADAEICLYPAGIGAAALEGRCDYDPAAICNLRG